jgi:phosphoketolase
MAAVNYMIEPGRFRFPRTHQEADFQSTEALREQYFPAQIKTRIFVSHIRPEMMVGVLRPLDTGPQRTHFLGFINQGGTLDTGGMLFANQQTWAHIIQACAGSLEMELTQFLEPEELAALNHQISPYHAITQYG